MQERVILIGGAGGQCHIITVLQQKGYYVIVVDYDKNCSGSKIADEFHEISTTDVETIEILARKNKVKAVMAVQSDIGLRTSNEVSARLGLKGMPKNIVELFTDKYKMREYLKMHAFPYPEFKKCKTQDEVEGFAKKNGFPFVMKPLDSQGSRGVEIISSREEFDKINNTIVYSKKEAAVIVEDYLGSDEYTVEGIVINGKHTTLAVSKKRHYKDLKCVSCELYYSWEREYDELIKLHNKLINSTQMPFGITHSEYIKTKTGFVLVEFTARGGGAMISSHIVPKISGWDVEEIYANQILGLPIKTVPCEKNCAVLKFVELEYGVIRKIDGIDIIRKMENVLHFELMYKPGQEVLPVTNDTNRHGYFIAWAKNKKELDRIIDVVEDLLEVEYEK